MSSSPVEPRRSSEVVRHEQRTYGGQQTLLYPSAGGAVEPNGETEQQIALDCELIHGCFGRYPIRVLDRDPVGVQDTLLC